MKLSLIPIPVLGFGTEKEITMNCLEVNMIILFLPKIGLGILEHRKQNLFL